MGALLGLSLCLAAAASAASTAPVQGQLATYEGSTRLKLPPAAVKADEAGLKHLIDGSYDEAAKAFGRSLKAYPKNPRALANRGVALARLGRLDDALKDFQAAAALAPALKDALKPQVVDARVRRGKAWQTQGNVPKALDDFYNAIRADRMDGRGYAAVASVARETAQNETCLTYAGRAIDLGLETADLYGDRAACLAALGRPAEALKDLDKAILLDHGRADLYAARAARHLELGRRSAASRDAKRALQLDGGLAERLAPILRQ